MNSVAAVTPLETIQHICNFGGPDTLRIVDSYICRLGRFTQDCRLNTFAALDNNSCRLLTLPTQDDPGKRPDTFAGWDGFPGLSIEYICNFWMQRFPNCWHVATQNDPGEAPGALGLPAG